MVERYDLLTGGHPGGQMVASDRGEYVTFDDFNDLALEYQGVHATMLAIRDQRDKYSNEVVDLKRQRDELLDFVENVASGKRGDCQCWVCELARQAQEAILDAGITDRETASHE